MFDSLSSGPRCQAHEGTDLLVPILRQCRIGAGGEAHRVAAVVAVDEKVPRAGLDPDRGDGILPTAVCQIPLIIATLALILASRCVLQHNGCDLHYAAPDHPDRLCGAERQVENATAH